MVKRRLCAYWRGGGCSTPAVKRLTLLGRMCSIQKATNAVVSSVQEDVRQYHHASRGSYGNLLPTSGTYPTSTTRTAVLLVADAAIVLFVSALFPFMRPRLYEAHLQLHPLRSDGCRTRIEFDTKRYVELLKSRYFR